MNADDEKKLREIFDAHDEYGDLEMAAMREAYALGRRAGMTEAAECANRALSGSHWDAERRAVAAAIEKARDA